MQPLGPDPAAAVAQAATIWKLAVQRAKTIMQSAVITRRFIGTSAMMLYAFSSYPLAEPTSSLSLSLAHGTDSEEVSRRDPFAVNVRQIAARVGVKNPERLSIRIAEDTAGASVGANATIRSRGACVVLPMDLYEAFHATPEFHQEYDIPGKDEINFVLAHECAHIAQNHSVISGLALPLSLLLSTYTIKKVPNKFLAGVVGVFGLIGGNILLSWSLEHAADHAAAESGYAHGGISCFERKLSHNCKLRSIFNTRLITEEGNYLGDTSHPMLTSRIKHLRKIAETQESNCNYCLKL